MEGGTLSHLKQAPFLNINRGRLHPLPPSHLTVPGRSRRDLLFRQDAGTSPSLAKPLWTECKSSASDQIPAQPEPKGPPPTWSSSLDMNLVEAFRQLPEGTTIAAPKLEPWPQEGYKAAKFDHTVPYKFFNRENELNFIYIQTMNLICKTKEYRQMKL
jgi:hypothetical protein